MGMAMLDHKCLDIKCFDLAFILMAPDLNVICDMGRRKRDMRRKDLITVFDAILTGKQIAVGGEKILQTNVWKIRKINCDSQIVQNSNLQKVFCHRIPIQTL